MTDIITIPASVYRAYKPLIMRKGTARPQQRYSEFVRIGCTAYDFTLTWSDSYVVLRVQWPKPKDWGNAHEGECWYLAKHEYEGMEYTAKYGAKFPIPETWELPFRDDILKDGIIQTFIDLNASSYKEKNVIPCSRKKVSAQLMAKVMRACDTICGKGDHDGMTNAPIGVDFGCNETVPVHIASFVNSIGLTLDALVMPIR